MDTTQKLMLEEGYASVSARRVAKDAGVTSALVHYYYPATDDLLIALFRRTSERSHERLTEILIAENPVPLLWSAYADPTVIALAVEFMALANHRKALQLEISRYIETSRALQAAVLSRILKDAAIDLKTFPPVGASMLFAGALRALVMEQGLGIKLGHREAELILENLIEYLAPGSLKKKAAS